MTKTRQFTTFSTADLVALQSVVEKQIELNLRVNRVFGRMCHALGTDYLQKLQMKDAIENELNERVLDVARYLNIEIKK